MRDGSGGTKRTGLASGNDEGGGVTEFYATMTGWGRAAGLHVSIMNSFTFHSDGHWGCYRPFCVFNFAGGCISPVKAFKSANSATVLTANLI